MKLNVSKAFAELSKLAGKYLPEILAGAGVVGIALTAIETAKATKKATKTIEEANKKSGEINTKEKVKLTWKYYISPVVTGVCTAGAIIGSTAVSSRRYAAMSTLYFLADKAAKEGKEYESKAKEILGEEKHNEIKKEVHSNENKRYEEDEMLKYGIDGNEMLTFVEKVTGQKFKSSLNKLNQVRYYISEQVLTEGYVMMDVLFDELGMSCASVSENYGWTIKDLNCGLVNFEYLPVFDSMQGYRPTVIDTSARLLDIDEMY